MKKLILLALLFSTSANAQTPPTLLIAAASSSGTYHTMLGQIMNYCNGPSLSIKEVPIKGGATDNLAALVDNDVSAAFMHSDVIYAKSAADAQYREFKTLVALYPEEIHVLALKDSGLKTKGKWGTGMGAQPIVFNTLADLAGYTVGAAGGGALTANVLKGTGEVPFHVHAYDTGAEVIPALDWGRSRQRSSLVGRRLATLRDSTGAATSCCRFPKPWR